VILGSLALVYTNFALELEAYHCLYTLCILHHCFYILVIWSCYRRPLFYRSASKAFVQLIDRVIPRGGACRCVLISFFGKSLLLFLVVPIEWTKYKDKDIAF
jgi:hypothetical protein